MASLKLLPAAVAVFILSGPGAIADVAITQPNAYRVERLVPSSAFHGVHGIRFDSHDALFAASIFGQSLYAVDRSSGQVCTVIGPPEGEADDLVFSPVDGGVVWTSVIQGILHKRVGDGPVEILAKLPGVNSIAFSRDGKRLFAAQISGDETLWEIDYSGIKPPRVLAKHIGGLNAFDVGRDGKIYGPLYQIGKIGKIDPDTGEVTILAEGFTKPPAVKFDSKGNLYVEDSGSGEMFRLDIRSGVRTLVARLRPGLDNLAIDSKDRIFASNYAENGIQEIDPNTGAVRQVVRGVLTSPTAMAVVSDGDHDTLYVADRFDLRFIDGTTGVAKDIARSPAYSGFYAVGANDKNVVMPTREGGVEVFDRKSGKFLGERPGVQTMGDLLELPDGSLVSGDAKGNLVEQRDDHSNATVVSTGFKGLLSLTWAGGDVVYASESAAGQITSVDLRTGVKQVIASDLKLPKGVAVTPDGAVVIVEAGAHRLVRLDPKTGEKSIIAADLPIGFAPTTPNAPLEGQIGVGVGKSGVIYVVSNVENSIYRITPRIKMTVH